MAIFLLGVACQRPQGGYGGRADVFPQPTVGSVATFQEYPRWQVGGTVTVLDERTLRFENFSVNNLDHVPAELRLQRDRQKVAVIRDLTDASFDDATFDVALPDRLTLADFNLVTVYNLVMGTPVSGARFWGLGS